MKKMLLNNIFILCGLLFALSIAEDSGDVCHKQDVKSSKLYLKCDQASFKVLNVFNNRSLTLKGVSKNCDQCLWMICANLTSQISVIVDTNFPYQYQIFIDDQTEPLCSKEYHFGEHGEYIIYIDGKSGKPFCKDILVNKEPDLKYLSLVILFAILVVLVVAYVIFNIVWKRYMSRRLIGYVQISDFGTDDTPVSLESSSKYGTHHVLRAITSVKAAQSSNTRITSLDTFRGISITIMIFVNYGGGKYWFFNHSKWNGLTVADLVFPWFIFIMGASIFISFQSLRKKCERKSTIAIKISIRAVKLLALGLFLNNGYDYEHWRLPGVLQRFALSYFVVAMINCWLSPDEDQVDTHYNYDWRDAFRDLTWFPLQHAIMILLLIVYLLITFLVHDSKCPSGYLGPGGIGNYGNYSDCTGGAAGYIDKQVFGVKHIYQHPTCKNPYKCGPYDPEGLLGVIPSILLTYLGLQASRILFMYSRQRSHIKRWLLWGVIWGVIACGLCGGVQNNGIIPVNKNLWSLSFILATASLAYFLLTFCYVVVDVKHWWKGEPFYFSGMNAILLYCGHEVLGKYFPFDFRNNGTHGELLTRSAIGTGVWVVIAYVCFIHDVFLKL